MTDTMRIVAMQKEQIGDLNKTNEPFLLFGRLVPTFHDDVWSFTEELFETPSETKFPDDRIDCETYINQPDEIIYLAYAGGACIGQIRLVKQWNKYCYVENLAVCQAYRQSGIGRQLFRKAEAWAKERGLLGITLEAQDDNLAACRFYQKMGMVLGGVDTMRYAFNLNIDKALFWYLKF